MKSLLDEINKIEKESNFSGKQELINKAENDFFEYNEDFLNDEEKDIPLVEFAEPKIFCKPISNGLFQPNVETMRKEEINDFDGFENVDFQYGNYFGQLQNGLKHGRGIMQYKNGETYEGGFENDERSGYGVFESISGIFKGIFKNGVLVGEGELRYPNGDLYKGNFNNSLPDGYGECQYANKNSYAGIWKKGLFDIEGKYVWNSGMIYTGTVSLGEITGSGVLVFLGNFTYNGELKKGLYHGYGTLNYESGDTYYGYWIDGKKCGKGTYVYSQSDIFEGNYANDMREGYGIMNYNNGNTYFGNWVKDYFSGEGIYNWAKGDSYSGNFLNGMLNGNGLYTTTDKTEISGIWENNLLIHKDLSIKFSKEFINNCVSEKRSGPYRILTIKNSYNEDTELRWKILLGQRNKLKVKINGERGKASFQCMDVQNLHLLQTKGACQIM